MEEKFRKNNSWFEVYVYVVFFSVNFSFISIKLFPESNMIFTMSLCFGASFGYNLYLFIKAKRTVIRVLSIIVGFVCINSVAFLLFWLRIDLFLTK